MNQISLDDLELLVLFDNHEYRENCKTSWGFSCLIETRNQAILFDSGADGEILEANMKLLRVHPQDLTHIVISHDHWDHTGGLFYVLDHANSNVKIHLTNAFSPSTINHLQTMQDHVTIHEEPAEILDSFLLTGPVRSVGNDPTEQALIINTNLGFIMLTGCSHPGIVRFMEIGRHLSEAEPLLLFGGFHLLHERPEQWDSIIERLLKRNVQFIMPTHCTGDEAIDRIARAFGDRYIRTGVGKVLKGSDLVKGN